MTDKQIKEVFKNGFYCIEPCIEIKQLHEQLDQLKAENGELRKNLVDKHTSRCFRLVTHREFDKLIMETVQLRQENKKLKQTLTELKKIMDKHCRKCKKHKFYNFKLCCTCKYTDILQKISEVEDEHTAKN